MTALYNTVGREAVCAGCGGMSRRILSPFASVGLALYPDAVACNACNQVDFTRSGSHLQRPLKVTSRRTAALCASCKSPVSELPNPYYGAKRSAEPFIRFCTVCGPE